MYTCACVDLFVQRSSAQPVQFFLHNASKRLMHCMLYTCSFSLGQTVCFNNPHLLNILDIFLVITLILHAAF